MGEALLFAKVRACFGKMEIFHKKYLKNGKKFVILFMGEYFSSCDVFALYKMQAVGSLHSAGKEVGIGCSRSEIRSCIRCMAPE